MSDTSIARLALPRRDIYPRREERLNGVLERAGAEIAGVVQYLVGTLGPTRPDAIADRVAQCAATMSALDDAGIEAIRADIGAALRQQGFRLDNVARAFALISEQARRSETEPFEPCHYAAGWVMLRGRIAETVSGGDDRRAMQLAAATAALAGVPVHMVAADADAALDAVAAAAPIYDALGLRWGIIEPAADSAARRTTYRQDIVHVGARELGFDYLRDSLVLGERASNLQLKLEALGDGKQRVNILLLRGLSFALVEQADRLLIDEARTPFVISDETRSTDVRRFAEQAMALAKELGPGADYLIDEGHKLVELTARGRERLETLAQGHGGLWAGHQRREATVCLALAALDLWRAGADYAVHQARVHWHAVDGGPDPDGLRDALIEIKEEVESPARATPVSQMSFQQMFRRYRRLGGASQAARACRRELWSIYGAPVEVIRKVGERSPKLTPVRVFGDGQAKWQAVAERAAALGKAGSRVVIAVRGESGAETARAALAMRQVPVMPDGEPAAEDDAADAVVVVHTSGGLGTGAGRGANSNSGRPLALIIAEPADIGRQDRATTAALCAARVDRFVGLDDAVFRFSGQGIAARALRSLAVTAWPGQQMAGRLAFRHACRRAARLQASARRDWTNSDQRIDRLTAYSGKRT